jgi:hypothetical protein
MVSPLLNAMKNKVARKVCQPKVEAFKKIIFEIVSDPIKFNSYPKLAYAIDKAIIVKEGLLPVTLDFSHLKIKDAEGQDPKKIDINKLKSTEQLLLEELGIEGLESCLATKNIGGYSSEQFFHSVIQDNQFFDDYQTMHAIANGSGEDGDHKYTVTCSNIVPILLQCEGVPSNYDMGCLDLS